MKEQYTTYMLHQKGNSQCPHTKHQAQKQSSWHLNKPFYVLKNTS